MSPESEASTREMLERAGRLENLFLALLKPSSDSQFWRDLGEFKRELHTLKGVCGMAGLQEPARRVHHLESLLAGEAAPDSPQSLTRTLEPPLQELLNCLRKNFERDGLEDSDVFAPVLKGDLLRQLQALQKENKTVRHLSYEKQKSGRPLKELRQALEDCSTILTGVPEVQGDSVRFHFLVLDTPPMTALVEEFQLESFPFQLDPPAEPSSEQPAPSSSTSGSGPDPSRIDQLHHVSSDLAAQFWRLKQAEDLQGETWEQFESSVKALQQNVQMTRMVKLESVFNRFPLEVRAVGRAQGKELEFHSQGEQIEVDRDVANGLIEPLRHLLLNAISHGIEEPQVRAQTQKSAVGRVQLSASLQGSFLKVEVQDDGMGIDRAKLSRSCQRPLESEQELLEQLCRPGWSSRSSATLAAGRGLGLDIVARSLNHLRGSLSLRTVPGEGTTFTLTVPTRLAVLTVLVVPFGDISLAFARDSVRTVVPTEELVTARSGEATFCDLDGQNAPVYDVARLLELPSDSTTWTQALLCRGMTSAVVLRVPPASGIQEVVVQPCLNPFLEADWLDGITTLTTGSIAYLVSIPGLVERALRVYN